MTAGTHLSAFGHDEACLGESTVMVKLTDLEFGSENFADVDSQSFRTGKF